MSPSFFLGDGICSAKEYIFEIGSVCVARMTMVLDLKMLLFDARLAFPGTILRRPRQGKAIAAYPLQGSGRSTNRMGRPIIVSAAAQAKCRIGQGTQHRDAPVALSRSMLMQLRLEAGMDEEDEEDKEDGGDDGHQAIVNPLRSKGGEAKGLSATWGGRGMSSTKRGGSLRMAGASIIGGGGRGRSIPVVGGGVGGGGAVVGGRRVMGRNSWSGGGAGAGAGGGTPLRRSLNGALGSRH